MSIHLDKILGEFASTESDPKRAFDVLKRIGRALGYDHAIADFSKGSTSSRIAFHASTHPEQWNDEKQRLTAAEVLKDPIVSHLRSRVDPIFWSRANYEQAGMSQFYERFRDQGLGSGIALAVRGLHGETLSVGLSNSERSEKGKSAPVLQMGALFLSATAMFSRIAASEEKLKKLDKLKQPKLTPREIECLQWARTGKTGWEIAKILGISQATAIFHMKNSISKLEASNKTHAVIVAVERGLID